MHHIKLALILKTLVRLDLILKTMDLILCQYWGTSQDLYNKYATRRHESSLCAERHDEINTRYVDRSSYPDRSKRGSYFYGHVSYTVLVLQTWTSTANVHISGLQMKYLCENTDTDTAVRLKAMTNYSDTHKTVM